MTYREIQPSAALRPWVECFWTRSASVPTAPVRILPDGCADLLLTGGEAFAVGTMTRTLVLNEEMLPEMTGIRFRPGRAAPFLKAPLGLFTDERVGISAFDSLADQVADSSSTEVRVRLLEAALLRVVAKATPDLRIDRAVVLITGSGGLCDIDEIARQACVSRQHLARLFGVHVGLTPKTFARVVRFRRALDLVRDGTVASAADLAVSAGFYDQSHLIAEFRELAGATPVPFFLSHERRGD